MNKEEISTIAQLLSSMKDAINELDKAKRKKDIERTSSAKKEIISFKEQLDKLL